MGKLERLEIQFEHPNAVVTAGETLLGQVLMHLNEPMRMRHIRIWIQGRAKVHWTKSSGSGSSRHTTHYRAEEIYFEENFILTGSDHSDESMTHPAGQHVYNFQVVIPRSCPSSFEGEYGYVRYICKATVDRPWKFDHDTKAAFSVISFLDLNTEPANLNTPIEGQETKEVTCCCCVSGSISATFRINKTGFVPGENIIVNAVIKNHSNSSIDNARVAIKQYVTFYGRSDSLFSSGDLKPKCSSEVVADMQSPEIQAGKEDFYTDRPLRVPPVPPTRLVGCSIIDIAYVVKFYVNAWDSIKFANDIVIGTIPLRQSLYPPDHYGPIVEQPMPSALPSTRPDAPPQPAALDFELPPPSYEECVKGHRQIVDDSDSQYTRGQLNWAPSYPTYHWPPPGRAGDMPGPSNQLPLTWGAADGLPAYPGPDGLTPMPSAPADIVEVTL